MELSISGLKPGPKKLPDQIFSQPAVSLLPGGGELVIAAENDVIQFYDAVNDRHLHKLQVWPSNIPWKKIFIKQELGPRVFHKIDAVDFSEILHPCLCKVSASMKHRATLDILGPKLKQQEASVIAHASNIVLLFAQKRYCAYLNAFWLRLFVSRLAQFSFWFTCT